MCGIYGIWHRNQRAVDVTQLRIATHCLIHRGPDDEGYLLIDPVRATVVPLTDDEILRTLYLDSYSLAFGFRRLAILDLSPSGHQPMGTHDGYYWIVFNGEIYNYRELRSELQLLGHTFKSNTDTEVLLHTYVQWGEACLERLNGM